VNIILLYISGLLVSCNYVFCWFESPLKEYITWKIFNKSSENLIIDNPFFGKLFNCTLCFSTWISFFVALFLFIGQLNYIRLVLMATFSYPFIILFIKKIYENYLGD